MGTLLHDGPGSYLIMDDSVQDKRYSKKIESKKIELVKRQYPWSQGLRSGVNSGAAGGLVDGIGVVNNNLSTCCTQTVYTVTATTSTR